MTSRFTTTTLILGTFLILGACASVPRGRTAAIHEAADSGDLQTLKAILADNSKVDARDETGRTALHHAADGADILAAAALLDAGADPNLRDVSGRSPLHYAALSCSPDMAAMLLGAGADAAIVDKKDISALDLAIETECEEVAQTITSSL